MYVTSLQICLPNIIENGCCTITEQSDDEEQVMQEWNATTFLSNLEKAPYVCFAGVKITDETGSVFYTWHPPAEVNLSEGTARHLGWGTNDISVYLKMLHLL